MLGAYPDVESVSSALGDWGPRALEVGGLDWLRYQTRKAERADLKRQSSTGLGFDDRDWLRVRLADSSVPGAPDLGVGIEHT